MGYCSGELVGMNHFSIAYTFKACINRINSDDTVGLTIVSNLSLADLNPGDPIAMAYKLNNGITRCRCTIISIDKDNSYLNVKIEEESNHYERRAFERYPVSLYAKALTTNNDSFDTVYIKDLSMNGIGIVSKVDYFIEQILKIYFYIGKEKIILDTLIVWIEKKESNFNYGLKFIAQVPSNKIETYIKELESKYNGIGLDTSNFYILKGDLYV